jgi:hypothetical protein
LCQHLESPIHTAPDERIKCAICLRLFFNATALTQHLESESVRCSARNLSGYKNTIEDATVGITTTSGRHDDDTVKYKINNTFKVATLPDRLLSANKKLIDEEKKRKENHWKNTTPKW